MSKYNVSAGSYQGSPPEDLSAAFRRCFTERRNQMDGLGCILKYCQLESGFKVGHTDVTGYVVDKMKMYELPRVKWQLDQFWYSAIRYADSNIAQVVGQDQNDDLLLYIVQMNRLVRRADKLVVKVKDKLGLGEWAFALAARDIAKPVATFKTKLSLEA
ncbi:hypothetical protein BG000_000572 [Podila horticola]|nr:hypothetical protein BG000_000572 [Podila horticola]